MTDDQKAEFFSWFKEDGTTLPMIRQRIEERYKIKLQFNSQVSGKWGLRKWCWREENNAEVAKWAAIEEAKSRKDHPDWGPDDLSRELLLRMKRRALAEDDFMLALQTLKADSRDAKIKLEREKLLESNQSDALKALEVCIEHAKKYPEVIELFRGAFVALDKARAA
jgi:hypothetical protein